METNFFNNIQGKVKKMEGVSESRKENQTKGDKKGYIICKCPQKISRYQNKKFFGTELKINIITKYELHKVMYLQRERLMVLNTYFT